LGPFGLGYFLLNFSTGKIPPGGKGFHFFRGYSSPLLYLGDFGSGQWEFFSKGRF